MCPALAYDQSRDTEHGPLYFPFPVALAVTSKSSFKHSRSHLISTAF
jgi:hypothetical protein